MPVVVERAVTADAFPMADVLVASSRSAYAGLVSDSYLAQLSVTPLAESYVRSLDRGDEYWLARDGAHVVGMARAGEPREASPPRELELMMLYVAPNRFGNGIGSELLLAAIGTAPCLLWVATANPRASRFYERQGFAFDGAVTTIEAVDGIEGRRMVR
jgi:ribosomal protein S18 acetylase RimI-like enzyme